MKKRSGADFLQSRAMGQKPAKIHRHDARHPTNGKYIPKKGTGRQGTATYNDGRSSAGPFDYL